MGSHGYRDQAQVLHERHSELRGRVCELDDEAPPSMRRRLPAKLRSELSELRAASEPVDNSVESLMMAEQAVEQYERKLDEALGLAAELGRSVNSFIPRRGEIVRWAGFSAASVALMMLVVQQLGLWDFMLQAVGVRVLRASADIPSARVSFQAAPWLSKGETPDVVRVKSPAGSAVLVRMGDRR
jgi:hypothetical protein